MRAAGHGHDVDRLLVGAERRVQAALGTLDLAEVVAAADRQGAFAGRPPLRGNRRQQLLGFGEPAAHPLGEAEVAAGVGRQHPLVVTEPGQGLRRERDSALGVAAERGEVRTLGRDRRGHVHQPAIPAGRRHGRLTRHVGSARLRALGGIQQLPGRLHPAAGQGQARPGQQQPRPRTGYVGRDGREPPLRRRPLAPPEEDLVEMPFDQPGSPEGIPRCQRMPDGVVGQPVLLQPGGRVAVYHGDPLGLLLEAGAEQVGEQMVVAPPAAHLIQRHQEQVRPLHPLQHDLAVGPAGDRVAQPATQPFQHRGLQQESAYLGGLAVQDFLGQVVQNVAVGTAKGRHEPGHVGPSAQ